jgi:hypothetical protein
LLRQLLCHQGPQPRALLLQVLLCRRVLCIPQQRHILLPLGEVADIQEVPLHCLQLLGEPWVFCALLLLLLLAALKLLEAALQLDAFKVADLQPRRGQPTKGERAVQEAGSWVCQGCWDITTGCCLQWRWWGPPPAWGALITCGAQLLSMRCQWCRQRSLGD